MVEVLVRVWLVNGEAVDDPAHCGGLSLSSRQGGGNPSPPSLRPPSSGEQLRVQSQNNIENGALGAVHARVEDEPNDTTFFS